jgi:hypothetical protein
VLTFHGNWPGAALDLFEWEAGVSEFWRVIKPNFAESLQPLINISFGSVSMHYGDVVDDDHYTTNLSWHAILMSE